MLFSRGEESATATSYNSLLADPLLAGAGVHEGYKILGGTVLYRKIGQGGMGAIYLGRHLRLDIDVAVKVMAPPGSATPEDTDAFIGRFLREARTAAAINHQNLIRVLDVNSEGGVYFLVMDFVDGESAAERLKRTGKLTEPEAGEICLGAAAGLAEAHRDGIVHRDVKPDNIMIDRKGRVRVTDLGLAKAYSDEAGGTGGAGPDMLTQTQAAIGTPCYMSPEQFASSRTVGPPADVWSLGVTLFHLLAGRPPWFDGNVFALAGKIQNEPAPDLGSCVSASAGICGIVERALRKEAPERYADCGEFARALRRHLDSIGSPGESVLADETDLATRATRATSIDASVPASSLPPPPPPPQQTMTLIGASYRGDREARPISPDTPPTAPHAALPSSATSTGPTLDEVVEKRLQAEELRARVEGAGDATEALRRADMDIRVAKEIELRDPTSALARLERAVEALSSLLEGPSGGSSGAATTAPQTRAEPGEEAIRKAECEERRGDLRAALGHYREAAKQGADAAGKIASLEADLGYFDALAHARQILGRGRLDEAARALDDILLVRPGDPEVLRLLSEVDSRRNPPLVLDIGGGVKMEFVLVEPGSFAMGSEAGQAGAPDEQPVHEVLLRRAFHLGRHPVTLWQFKRFVGRSGYRTEAEDGGWAYAPADGGLVRTEGVSWRDPGFAQNDNHPVVCVSWNDAAAFCDWAHVQLDRQCRLPSEAEWEYACRADTEPAASAPVVGVGNVSEWCADWYLHKYYKKSPRKDPAGPRKGKERVARGGSYLSGPAGSGPTRREHYPPSFRSSALGFRLALTVAKK